MSVDLSRSGQLDQEDVVVDGEAVVVRVLDGLWEEDTDMLAF